MEPESTDDAPPDELLRECAREPIRVPGAIQPHGALLAFGGDGRVTRASRNLDRYAGVAAEAVLGRPLSEVIELPESFRTGVDLPRRGAALVSAAAARTGEPLRAAVHRAGEEFVVEFERAEPEDGATAEVDDCELVTRLLERTRGLDEVVDLCGAIVDEVRTRTGFDHVMAYRFDEQFNGEVIAESCGGALGPYLGLHYPASDIPEQARALYLETRVRLLADVGYEPVGLAESLVPSGETGPGGSPPPPLDMTGCRLRSMSPIHRVYLRNMGVAASLVISVVVDGRLWGLIACHHASPRRVRLDAAHSLSLVSEMLSVRVQVLEEVRMRESLAARFAARNAILDRLHTADDIVGELSQVSDDLAAMLGADGLVLWFGDDVSKFGRTPNDRDVAAIVGAVGRRDADEPFITDSLRRDLPDARLTGDGIAGLAALQFRPRDFVLFFREEQSRAVRWGGDPSKAVTRDDAGRLMPRASFAEWVERVGGACRPWSEVDRRTARDFRNAMAVFILRRSRELKELNRRLRQKTDEIEQFVYSVSHDLKSPLVTCQGFLGVMREDVQAGRYGDLPDSLGRIERAAGTMGAFVSDLLAFSRIGRAGDEAAAEVDLNEVLEEVIGQLGPQIRERGAAVGVEGRLPTYLCRRRDVVRVFDNLLVNALKYGCDRPGPNGGDGGAAEGGGPPRIEVSCRSQPVEHVISVRDWGGGIPLEYHAKAMRLFQRIHTKKSGTGVGLASVAKIMELMGGRVWLDNPEGGGLAVRLALPRDVIPDRPDRRDPSTPV